MNATVSTAALNRAVFARQCLLERATMPIDAVLERIGGIQAQYAPSMYVGLWSRLAGFGRADLDAALAGGSVVQGTLMRATIHLVSRADYWPMAVALRQPRRDWFLRAHRPRVSEAAMTTAAERARLTLADGPVGHAQLAAIVGPAEMAGLHLFVDIVRIPPSGTWARRRANLYGLAEHWVGPEPAITAEDADDHLVRRYLTAFCPSRPGDIAKWAGLPTSVVLASLERIDVERRRDEAGKELFDLAGQTVGSGDEPVPVRFLPTWDATLLAHCRGAVIIREDDRARIFTSANPPSEATFCVAGVVEGTWRHDGEQVRVAPFISLPGASRAAVEEEAARLDVLFAETAGERAPLPAP